MSLLSSRMLWFCSNCIVPIQQARVVVGDVGVGQEGRTKEEPKEAKTGSGGHAETPTSREKQTSKPVIHTVPPLGNISVKPRRPILSKVVDGSIPSLHLSRDGRR